MMHQNDTPGTYRYWATATDVNGRWRVFPVRQSGITIWNCYLETVADYATMNEALEHCGRLNDALARKD